MTEANKMCVEVAYALPDKAEIVMLEVLPGTTAREAVQSSEIEKYFDNITLDDTKLGIFGKAVKDDHVLETGDRVEIYRPLIADPKEARKKRAAQARERRAEEKAEAKSGEAKSGSAAGNQ